jgi:hypothetical protein
MHWGCENVSDTTNTASGLLLLQLFELLATALALQRGGSYFGAILEFKRRY